MRILRRKKLMKHINTITYVSLFSIATIAITVAVVCGKDKTEYKEFSETETYVVDIVSQTRENLAAIDGAEPLNEVITASDLSILETQKEAETKSEAETKEETTAAEETTQDLSSYKGIFVMNTSGNLNIRSKADTSAEVVGILTEGNGGDVLKYGEQWTKIQSGKVTGYVATEFILIDDKAKEAMKENGYTAIINADTLMVRSERSTDSSILGMVAQGEEFQCKKVYSKWVKITFEGQTGYVSREFVKLENVMTYAKSVEEIEAERASEAAAIAAQQQAEQQEQEAQNQAAQEQSSQSQNVQTAQSQTTNNQTSQNNTTQNNTTQNTTKQVQKSEPQTQKQQTVDNTADASYDGAYLLACLVACEAGGESYESKLAVANVVLNRVASPAYPNSIKGVIYQGGQFGPVSNGSLARMLKKGPDSGSSGAASAALGGSNNVPGYLFFGTASSINTSNLKSYRQIDSQTFY